MIDGLVMDKKSKEHPSNASPIGGMMIDVQRTRQDKSLRYEAAPSTLEADCR